MTLYKLFASLHGLIGLVALLSFWTAGLAAKGRPVHRAAGKVYLLAMVAMIVSALPLSWRVATQVHWVAGVFVAYLEVIVTTSVWASWRAVRDKRDWAAYTGRVYHALAWLNVVSGLAVLVVGLFITTKMQAIFVGFSMIGLLGGAAMLRFARTRPADPTWWLGEHFGAMIGNGVATHIAFLSIGLPKVLPMLAGPVLQNIAWLGPLTVAVIARVLLNRKYRSKAMPAKTTGRPVAA
jgi:uncharacterized membrane protein